MNTSELEAAFKAVSSRFDRAREFGAIGKSVPLQEWAVGEVLFDADKTAEFIKGRTVQGNKLASLKALHDLWLKLQYGRKVPAALRPALVIGTDHRELVVLVSLK